MSELSNEELEILMKDLKIQAEIAINDLKTCSKFKQLHGSYSLISRLEKEIKTLEQLKSNGKLKQEHVICSNIQYLDSIRLQARDLPRVTHVLEKFVHKLHFTVVDVVSNGGLSWNKIIFRNPKELYRIFVAGNRKRTPSMDKVANKYLRVAKSNQIHFVQPKIVFTFQNGVPSIIAKELRNLGVEVNGKEIDEKIFNLNFDDSDISESDESVVSEDSEDKFSSDTEDKSSKLTEFVSSELLSEPVVNIDVTCLMAYVCRVANGGTLITFSDRYLTGQVEMERKCPVKNVIDSYINGKKMIICKEAVDRFLRLVRLIGGPDEISRGEEFLKSCTIVDGIDLFKDTLKLGGRVKQLSRIVFGTGHAYKAPTITSNEGFVRASFTQGVKISALVHEPRALTEQKERRVRNLDNDADLSVSETFS